MPVHLIDYYILKYLILILCYDNLEIFIFSHTQFLKSSDDLVFQSSSTVTVSCAFMMKDQIFW